MTEIQRRRWAASAVRRAPCQSDYVGCSYEEASRRALAICAAAVETGRTVNAGLYLIEFSWIMQWLAPKAA
jgi:hypothetical protein